MQEVEVIVNADELVAATQRARDKGKPVVLELVDGGAIEVSPAHGAAYEGCVGMIVTSI